jgi:hypothetical protein
MKSMTALTLTLLLITTSAPARDMGGVTVPDHITVEGEAQTLALNGAGYRKKFFVKVYIGALYLPQPENRAEAILDANTPRAVQLHFVHDVSAGKLVDAWNDAFTANHPTTQLQALRSRLDQFNGFMRDVKSGDVLRLELSPRGATRVWFNGEQRGTLEGADFQRALLAVWLGPKPVDSDLKQALLAGKGTQP